MIHYRWHALYGRTVRRFYAEKRAGTEVVLVEGEPGAAIVVAAWMLDPLVCASMTIGAPRVPCQLSRNSIISSYNTDSGEASWTTTAS